MQIKISTTNLFCTSLRYLTSLKICDKKVKNVPAYEAGYRLKYTGTHRNT